MYSVGRAADASRGNSAFRAPAVRAVLIQLVSFFLALIAGQGVSALSGAPVPIPAVALLHGVIAAALSYWCGLAPWWLIIQASFPIAVIGTLSLQLPPVLFLAAFAVLLVTFWSTFRTQVPFYPSGRPAWEAVADALLTDRPLRVIDIGSGFGGLVLHLARRRPESAITGIEIAPLPWFVSLLRSWFSLGKPRFIRGDYEQLDFASYDVVFAYLSPAAMPALWQKAVAEMQPGSLLLSYEFDIPGAEPQLISTPSDGGPALFGWYM